MSRLAKIVNSTTLVVWLLLIGALLFKNYSGTPLEPSHIVSAFERRSNWYDIYAGSEKIGFANIALRKIGKELTIEDNREVKVITKPRDEEENKVLVSTTKCLCDLDYSIKSFEYSSHFKDEKGIKVTGEVDNDMILFFLESPDSRKTYKIPAQRKPFYLPLTAILAIQEKKPPLNTVFEAPILNLTNLRIEAVRITLEEIRPFKLSIDIVSIFKFLVGDSYIWMTENGTIIKEKYPSGMTLFLQSEKDAQVPENSGLFDYTELPYFHANKVIPDVETETVLKVRIKGMSLDTNLYEKSSVLVHDDILTIQKASLNELKTTSYTLPYTNSDLHQYLQSDPWVSSDYEPLKDTGRIYARAGDNDPFNFTHYLVSYLFNLIKPSPSFFLSSSENILRSLSGDYVERTVMFATYARAGGMPTRLVGGLVYRNGYFYFHTWPEVWFGKWVPVDPTLAQFPADVTHIPLKTGTIKDIVSIVDKLKDIKIEILEAS